MVLALALYQLGVGLASRDRAFRRVAKAAVANQASYVSVAVIVGALGAWSQGLIASKVAGQAAGVAMLWRSAGAQFVTVLRRFSFARVRDASLHYRQFLVFNTPYSLVGSVARDAPIYAFSALAALGAAGFFGLARTVLMAPALLLSNAFSQVFYREAVGLKGSPLLETLTIDLLRSGLVALAPLFAFCTVWGDAVFATLFGEGWRTAGVFAMVLAPAAWMSVQTGWPERLFEVHMRQGVSFVVQLGSDAVTAAAFIAAYLASRDAVVAVAAYALCNVVYHHVYLGAIFRVSGFETSALLRVLLGGWIVFLTCTAGMALLRRGVQNEGVVSWAAALALAVALAALLAWRAARRVQAHAVKEGTE
jgi:hypothetical protein